LKKATFSFQKRLKEIGMFFQGKDPVHQTMNWVAAELDEADIPYAVVGGMHSSVRNDYIECLKEKGRQDEYDARQQVAEEVLGC
jgi:hypothetical protein